jgi:cob(I)alamin adenosyltransferase
MSIVTKTGDDGTTALMFGRRVPKTHPRVEACGAVDELNAALGMARAGLRNGFIHDNLQLIQKDLIALMGELGLMPDDLPRYTKDGFPSVTPSMTARLDALVKEVEPHLGKLKGWATPGSVPLSAALDMARTVCRRAERRVCALGEPGAPAHPEIVVYLNRLGDLLWLLARRAEDAPGEFLIAK